MVCAQQTKESVHKLMTSELVLSLEDLNISSNVMTSEVFSELASHRYLGAIKKLSLCRISTIGSDLEWEYLLGNSWEDQLEVLDIRYNYSIPEDIKQELIKAYGDKIRMSNIILGA